MRPAASNQLLDGLLVLDCSILGPGLAGGLLADFGARVIKVESLGGDDIRRVTWPIVHEQRTDGEVESNSLFHLHVNRSKESMALDLSTPEAILVFEDLVRRADVVIEGMRPRFLEKKGLTFERLVELNPRIVVCSISGFGTGSPYERFPSHGVGFDAWCGVVRPDIEDDGSLEIPDQVNVGMTFGPVLAVTTVLGAVLRARTSGSPAFIEISQSDAAAYFDWYRIETEQAYRRPSDEVSGVAADEGRRRAPGLAGLRGAVRYQFYETADGHVLFMASERKFWHNFCEAVGRVDLFERWPGAELGDHAVGNRELKAELRLLFVANDERVAGSVRTPQRAHRPGQLARSIVERSSIQVSVHLVASGRSRRRPARSTGQARRGQVARTTSGTPAWAGHRSDLGRILGLRPGAGQSVGGRRGNTTDVLNLLKD